jgi:hypothetical protein
MPANRRFAVVLSGLLALAALPACGRGAPAGAGSEWPAAPSGDGWLVRVQAGIAAGEAQATAGEDGTLRLRHPAAGIEARFPADGAARLRPLRGGGPLRAAAGGQDWEIRLGTRGAGAVGAAVGARQGACLGDARVDAMGDCLRRVERDLGDGWTEWWFSAERGIEQGWTVAGEHDGEHEVGVEVEVEVEGGEVEVDHDGGGATITAAGAGGQRLRYSGLAARDAEGELLAAWMEPAPSGLRVVVDARQARFPIEIDPLLTALGWSAAADQASAAFGYSVAGAGDVDGDGFGDVVVGAFQYDNGQTNEGRIFVYGGSPSGLPSSATWTAESDTPDSLFGVAVSSAGDVNGDGFSDVAAGAHLLSSGYSHEGAAFVYLGSASGMASTPAWSDLGGQASGYFGAALSSAGDVNGDGFSDLAVGAWGFDNGEADEGQAYVYLGSASGLATTAAWTADSDQAGAIFGVSLSGAGDVDGDGFGDVVVGAQYWSNGQPQQGAAFGYQGSASGLKTNPSWFVEGSSSYQQLGVSIGRAGDVNGDGFADVVAGGYGLSNGQANEGSVLVFHGSAGGLSTLPSWSAEGGQAETQLGVSVAGAGDVNGDGLADVIAGAYGWDGTATDEGAGYLWLGSASGLGSSPDWSTFSGQDSAALGVSVASAGDVDGDGYGDVVLGAWAYDDGETDEGAAFLYYGAPAGLAEGPGWSVEGGQAGANLGVSVAHAGDVNGDGFGDVLAGAYLFSNDQNQEGRAFLYFGSASGLPSVASWFAEGDQTGAYLGWAVAGAGDVDGDGYADVLAGAYGYDNGSADEGRALLWFGSASGPQPTPWTAESDQISAYYGRSVAGAGDVDGDGYADLLAGAYAYDDGETNEGAAFLYLGSPSGPGSAAAWSATSNQSDAQFGCALSGAGDVDGDGFADVLVGALGMDFPSADEGRVWLFSGSASGLAASESWSSEGNQSGAFFGQSVAAAGDVNADGFGDVLIGAPNFDGSGVDEGAAFLWLGSGSGLGPGTADWITGSSQNSATYGHAVSSAGDLDGDGFGDIVVGAVGFDDNSLADQGAAFVFLGSGSGPGTAADWIGELGQGGAGLGYSVDGRGDVNGDGFSDLLAGANLWTNPEPGEGSAFLWFGNSADGGGLHPSPPWLHARDPVSTAPLAPGARSSSPGGFDVFVNLRSPFGRTAAGIELEVEPLGTPFDGENLSTVQTYIDTDVAGVTQQFSVIGLVPDAAYHWRGRLAYDPADGLAQARGPWTWGGLAGQPLGLHLRTACEFDCDGDGFCDDVDPCGDDDDATSPADDDDSAPADDDSAPAGDDDATSPADDDSAAADDDSAPADDDDASSPPADDDDATSPPPDDDSSPVSDDDSGDDDSGDDDSGDDDVSPVDDDDSSPLDDDDASSPPPDDDDGTEEESARLGPGFAVDCGACGSMAPASGRPAALAALLLVGSVLLRRFRRRRTRAPAAAVAAALALALPAPARAQEPELSPSRVAQEAFEVFSLHCADIENRDDRRFNEALVAVSAQRLRVTDAWERSHEAFLLYWRAVLGLCIEQPERAKEDLLAFVEAESGNPTFESLVQDARRRLRRLGVEWKERPATGPPPVPAPSPSAPGAETGPAAASSARFVLGLDGTYARVLGYDYGGLALDTAPRLAGPLHAAFLLRFAVGPREILASGEPGTRRPALLRLGGGAFVRAPLPVEPWVGIAVLLAPNPAGLEPEREVARVLAGPTLWGGLAIPLGRAPVALRITGSFEYLHPFPVGSVGGGLEFRLPQGRAPADG